MRFLYDPAVNLVVRSILRPFASWIPSKFYFPVTGRFGLKLPDDKVLILNSNPTCYIAKVLFWQGFEGFEYAQFRIFRELIKEVQVFVDIGANIGYYSLLGSVYNASAQVFAFEPLPNAVKFIQKNIRDNRFGNIEVNQIALSDSDGEATFFVSLNSKFDYVEDQLTSTGSLDENQGSRTSHVQEISVRTKKLDSWVVENNIKRIDLLKLDTEATEHIVLRGAAKVLQEHRPIIFCEVLPGRIEEELDTVFGGFDYVCYRIDSNGLTPVPTLIHEMHGSNDHLMVPREKKEKIDRFLIA